MPRSDNNVYKELREMLASNQSLLSEIDKLSLRDVQLEEISTDEQGAAINNLTPVQTNHANANKPYKVAQGNSVENDSNLSNQTQVSYCTVQDVFYPNIDISTDKEITLADIAAVEFIDLDDELDNNWSLHPEQLSTSVDSSSEADSSLVTKSEVLLKNTLNEYSEVKTNTLVEKAYEIPVKQELQLNQENGGYKNSSFILSDVPNDKPSSQELNSQSAVPEQNSVGIFNTHQLSIPESEKASDTSLATTFQPGIETQLTEFSYKEDKTEGKEHSNGDDLNSAVEDNAQRTTIDFVAKNSIANEINSDPTFFSSAATSEAIEEKIQIHSIISRIDEFTEQQYNQQKESFGYQSNENIENESYASLEINTWIAITSLMLMIWFFVWLNQNSINIYFQQKYHKQSPIELLDSFSVWQFGQVVHNSLENGVNYLFDNEKDSNSQLLAARMNYTAPQNLNAAQNVSQPNAYLPSSTSINNELIRPNERDISNEKIATKVTKIDEGSKLTASSQTTHFHRTYRDFMGHKTIVQPKSLRKIEILNMINPSLTAVNLDTTADDKINSSINQNAALTPTEPQYGYVLESNEKVFFIGDSLMQGVAPYVMNRLKSNFDVNSINLSKQSTGLTYTRSFNWIETIEKTLIDNPDIGLLVVMLGANDPWSMRVAKGEPYLKFKSEAWNTVYQNRIEAIYQLAMQKNIGIVWVGAPLMKEKELSSGVMHLNTLYKQVSQAYGGIYLDSNLMFSYKGDKYDAYAMWEGNTVKVRANDGVHFTPRGQKIIAEYVLSLIGVKKVLNDTFSDTFSDTIVSQPDLNEKSNIAISSSNTSSNIRNNFETKANTKPTIPTNITSQQTNQLPMPTEKKNKNQTTASANSVPLVINNAPTKIVPKAEPKKAVNTQAKLTAKIPTTSTPKVNTKIDPKIKSKPKEYPPNYTNYTNSNRTQLQTTTQPKLKQRQVENKYQQPMSVQSVPIIPRKNEEPVEIF